MVTAPWFLLLLAALAGERLYELRVAQRNLASVRRRGAVVVEEPGYRWIVCMHCLFFVACAAEVLLLEPKVAPAQAGVALAVALGAQGLRQWAMRSLGDRWNVRIVVVPSEPLVDRGPYRWMRHPNYLAVALELAAVPLTQGAVATAVVFSVWNAGLLARRIPREERALARGGVVGTGA